MRASIEKAALILDVAEEVDDGVVDRVDGVRGSMDSAALILEEVEENECVVERVEPVCVMSE